MTDPNVLWICTDQQRYDTLGCYGNEHVSTPAVDGLAERGVRFDRCFSQNPVCTPSRASVLTGRYPRTTRARQNGQDIPDDEVPVTRMLADERHDRWDDPAYADVQVQLLERLSDRMFETVDPLPTRRAPWQA